MEIRLVWIECESSPVPYTPLRAHTQVVVRLFSEPLSSTLPATTWREPHRYATECVRFLLSMRHSESIASRSPGSLDAFV